MIYCDAPAVNAPVANVTDRWLCEEHYEETTTKEQSVKLGQLLRSTSGRKKLAATLGPSLRRRRDYIYRQGFARQASAIVESFVILEDDEN
jgi:hypothetical protein